MNVSLDIFLENTFKDKHTYILSFALLFAILYLKQLKWKIEQLWNEKYDLPTFTDINYV